MLRSSVNAVREGASNPKDFMFKEGGVSLSDILTEIGSFMTAITTNSVTFGIVTVMIAGAIGRLAFKTVKRFIH